MLPPPMLKRAREGIAAKSETFAERISCEMMRSGEGREERGKTAAVGSEPSVMNSQP